MSPWNKLLIYCKCVPWMRRNSPALTHTYMVYGNFIGLFNICRDEAWVMLVLLCKNLKQLLDPTLHQVYYENPRWISLLLITIKSSFIAEGRKGAVLHFGRGTANLSYLEKARFSIFWHKWLIPCLVKLNSSQISLVYDTTIEEYIE